MKIAQRLSILAILFLFILSACAAPAAQSPTQVPAEATEIQSAPPTATEPASPSIEELLPNLEYPLDVTTTGLAQLKDGYFEEAAASGSATKTKVQLGDVHILGDINGDGTQDALVTLIVDPGGSGTFTYLVLVLNENGTPSPVEAVLLGDRIIVKSMAIEPGFVRTTVLTRKPDEPMTADPTVETTLLYKLLEGRLVEEK